MVVIFNTDFLEEKAFVALLQRCFFGCFELSGVYTHF